MVRRCTQCGVQAEVLTFVNPDVFGYPSNGARGIRALEYLCVECAPPGASSPCDPTPTPMVATARRRATRG